MADDTGPSAERTHPRYRLLIIGDGGLVLRTETLIAGSDDDAMALARTMAIESAVELWDGLRFIEQFALLTDSPGAAAPLPGGA